MATRMRWVQETLAGYEARAIWAAMAAARAGGQTQVDYLPSTDVVGGASIVTLRRKARCRACDQDMTKGAQAIQFAYRWTPDFHYRITESFIHPETCR